MTWLEFKSRLPRYLSPELEEELKAFFEAVVDLSDDYEHCIARLRATRRFKSIFGAPNACQTNMNQILSEKERREFSRDLYKTILGLAQTGERPYGLCSEISELLTKDNPLLEIANERTILVPMEALMSRKAQNVTTATAES
ncbi:MAG TPA: hypothetical protein VNE84_02750 [Candidatus Limnocylindria bacterium]|jgi:hypothetical protein|nr:hypothetical protein [Candidatus Limnocylindria bacterium]